MFPGTFITFMVRCQNLVGLSRLTTMPIKCSVCFVY